ncbi:unnamed protein product [Effrenium voratum]|nr:unnamed protein product [Effrenium voratum]
MSAPDSSPTERWLQQLLEECEIQEKAPRGQNLVAWIRSSIRLRGYEASKEGQDLVSCPLLAPCPLQNQRSKWPCSFLLQGPDGADRDRHRCSLQILDLDWKTSSDCKRLSDLLAEAGQTCSFCQQSLLLHRAAYLAGNRRVLLTFQSQSEEMPKHSWLRCQACKSKWALPQEQLLLSSAASFFSLLWFGPKNLPCEHNFSRAQWELGNAVFSSSVAEPLAMELRGPPLTSPELSAGAGTAKVQEGVQKVLRRAETLVQAELSQVLQDFRNVGPGPQGKRGWSSRNELSLRCGLRSRRLLEACALLRAASAETAARGAMGPLQVLGLACHLQNCLQRCRNLGASGPGEASADSAGSDAHAPARQFPSHGVVSERSRRRTDAMPLMPAAMKQRSQSAPPKFGQEAKEEPRYRSQRTESLDDSSLGPLLHLSLPKLASLASQAPRMIMKRAYATLLGEKGVTFPTVPSERSLADAGSAALPDERWTGLCEEPRKLLEGWGLPEPYDLNVAEGIKGMAVPLSDTDDVGALIAHALLSPDLWEQLRGRLPHCQGDCFSSARRDFDLAAEMEDPAIHVPIEAPDGPWTVQLLAPGRFHLLRHLAFGQDAAFCAALKRTCAVKTAGGKSRSVFWRSQCGQLILKEVRPAEADHLAEVAAPLAVRLGEALKGEPSLLCEVFGLFKVQKLGKQPRAIIVMRNLLHGTEGGDWQIFDIKGVGSHRTLLNNEEQKVKWDGGFVDTFDALPVVLRAADQESLELALRCDLRVLRDLGLVDYSLLVAYNEKELRIRLAIIDFLQPYSFNKQLESTVKKLVQRHEPTIVEPAQYAKRFQEFIRNAFQDAVG